MKKIAIALFCLLVSSCSTLSKQAAEHLANKNYQEALDLYERVLEKDPSDSDALVGLRKAREGVIDQVLIRVRMTRLASNHLESWEILRDIVVRERAWSVFPTGAVAFTQTEETEEAFRTLNNELMALAPQNKPFRTLFLIERYKILFPDAKLRTFDNYVKGAEENGKKFCLTKMKTISPSLPFYNSLIKKLCDVSHQKNSIAIGEQPLYKKVSIALKGSISFDFRDRFVTTATNSFQSSGWYNPQSKNELVLDLTGFFDIDENRYYESRIHAYTVSVPYTEYVSKSVMDPQSGQLRTVSEPQTQYRDEPRKLNYNVLHVRQRARASISGVANEKQISPFSLSFEETTEFTEQPQNLYQYKLYASKSGTMYTQNQWNDAIMKKFGTNLSESFTADFSRAYCDTISETENKPELINQSLYCLRQTIKAPPEVINRVFESEFFITPTQMMTLFKVVD